MAPFLNVNGFLSLCFDSSYLLFKICYFYCNCRILAIFVYIFAALKDSIWQRIILTGTSGLLSLSIATATSNMKISAERGRSAH